MVSERVRVFVGSVWVGMGGVYSSDAYSRPVGCVFTLWPTTSWMILRRCGCGSEALASWQRGNRPGCSERRPRRREGVHAFNLHVIEV